MGLRVVQWATGGVGVAAIKGVLEHPDLELVGCWVHSADKAGKDVGDIIGTEPLGVIATNSVDEILALDADAVIYAPLMANPDQVAALLRSGKNVVTPVGWLYPSERSAAPMREAALAGNATLHGTGMAPGGISEKFPLLFSAFSNNTSRLFSVDLDGSNEHEILSVPGRDPQVSPDGRRVIYGAGTFTATELMIADVSGSAIEHPRRIDTGTPIAWNMKWSPDGATIAFTARRAANDQLQVWLMNGDGSGAHALTSAPPDEGGAQLPSWSPDGRSLAVQTNAANHSAHIWVVDVSTGGATKLAAHTEVFLDEVPVWFPDGKRLAFQSTRTGRLEVWTINTDSTGLRQVTK